MIVWLWQRMWPRRLPILLALTLALMTAGAGLGLMGLAGWVVSAAIFAGGLSLAAIPHMTGLFMALRGLALCRAGFRYAERLLGHNAIFIMICDLRVRLFCQIGRLELARLYRLHLGEVLARMVRDVDSLDGLILRLLIPVAVLLLSVVSLFLVLDGEVAWLGVSLLLILGVLLPACLAWAGYRPSRKLDEQTLSLKSKMLDLTLGRQDLLANAVDQVWANRIMLESAKAQRLQLRLSWLDGLATAGVQLVGGLGALALIGFLVVGQTESADRLNDLAVAMSAILIMVAVIEVCAPIPAACKLIGALMAAISRLREFDDDVPPPENGLVHQEIKGTAPLSSGNDAVSLTLKSVSFSYEGSLDTSPRDEHSGRPKDIIKDVSLSLEPNDRLAVIGPSGSGKSTLAALISGFLKPESGSVLLSGREVLDYEEADRYQHICYVPQGGGLFDVSIRENLLLAEPHANDAALEKALESVGLLSELTSDVTNDAQQGSVLNLRVGENGSRLSGGQGRRLAVARALLRKPQILIVDEPTEGLDKLAAQRVLSSICAASQGRSLIIISHDAAVSGFTTQTLDLGRGSFSLSGSSFGPLSGAGLAL